MNRSPGIFVPFQWIHGFAESAQVAGIVVGDVEVDLVLRLELALLEKVGDQLARVQHLELPFESEPFVEDAVGLIAVGAARHEGLRAGLFDDLHALRGLRQEVGLVAHLVGPGAATGLGITQDAELHTGLRENDAVALASFCMSLS